jgi:hypothetical protein
MRKGWNREMSADRWILRLKGAPRLLEKQRRELRELSRNLTGEFIPRADGDAKHRICRNLGFLLRISLEDNCDMITTINEEGRQITESSRLYLVLH